MESSPKPTHRFSIWKLAQTDPPADGIKTKPYGENAQGRTLNDRHRHSAATGARLRPFSARCVLPSGVKLACETKHIEPARIEVAYKALSAGGAESLLNAKVSLEIDFFGFVRGTVRDASKTGFWMAPDIIYHELLVRKLAELRNPGLSSSTEQSDLERLTARITLRNPACVYRLVEDDTALYHAKIALLSRRVATLRTAQIQRAGTRVLLGWPDSHSGTVMRSFESGFTVEFDEALDDLHENLTFA